MNTTVRPPMKILSLIFSFSNIIIAFGIVVLTIYFIVKVILALKDVKAIKENTARIVELLEENKE